MIAGSQETQTLDRKCSGTYRDHNKDAFYNELNTLIPSQQAVIVGIDDNAKMRLEQQSDVLRKWSYGADIGQRKYPDRPL
ncbi:hypothetical protein RB195_025534 [Necator americanus]